MRVCVCLRQVPDPQARIELLLGDGASEELPWVVGEADECALEEAVRLASAREGSDVCALTAGPPRATEALRRALALGAHRAQILPLEAPLAPRELARRLASVVRRDPVDLVITGAQSSDLGWGLTGTLLAAELGWPHVWLAVRAEHDLDPRDGAPSLVVTRELEGRRHERSRLRLPAVLCVQSGIHRPRMPRIRDVLAAKQKKVEVLEALPDRWASSTPPRADRRRR